MKVILQQDVKGKGRKGQTVEVADGYARNYLLPRNLAVVANADNMNALRIKEKARLAQMEREKAEALDGAVTSKEISDALAEQHGMNIEKNRIVQSEPIKSFGTYEVKCKLGYEVSGIINLVVTEAK